MKRIFRSRRSRPPKPFGGYRVLCFERDCPDPEIGVSPDFGHSMDRMYDQHVAKFHVIPLDFQKIADRFHALQRGGCRVQNPGDPYSRDVRVSSLGFDPDHPEDEKFGLSRSDLCAVLGVDL